MSLQTHAQAEINSIIGPHVLSLCLSLTYLLVLFIYHDMLLVSALTDDVTTVKKYKLGSKHLERPTLSLKSVLTLQEPPPLCVKLPLLSCPIYTQRPTTVMP